MEIRMSQDSKWVEKRTHNLSASALNARLREVRLELSRENKIGIHSAAVRSQGKPLEVFFASWFAFRGAFKDACPFSSAIREDFRNPESSGRISR